MGSVLLHATVISLVLSLFSPVEFQVYEKVADVIIASPDRIRIPPVDRTLGWREDISVPGNLPSDEQSPEGASEARRIAEGESEITAGRTIRRGRLPQASETLGGAL